SSDRDWSSDVCSSDLCIIAGFITLSVFKSRPARTHLGDQALKQLQDESAALQMAARTQPDRLASPDVALAIGLFGMSALAFADRSEERRVGREGRWRG